ncbi:hypothetical protein Bbelb_121460 [Branchiostoma belcheri]|nr:hypothetical protein Bbelb_121460 [Branchiostoma belcheri]
MSNKAREMLVLQLVLIILKEAGPTAACSSSCSLDCDCSWRHLSSVPQDLPTDITQLDLGGNAITTLNQSDFLSLTAGMFAGLGNLGILWLHNNQLTSLPADIFVGIDNLWKLWLDRNWLTSLPVDIFVGIDNLEELYLDSNNIHSIEAGTFNDTTKLRTLDLFNNNISTITADTLGNLRQLETLKLSHNNINTFPVEALSNLNMLSELTLDSNQLETLPLMAYDILANISTVNIKNNPWQCDCRMAPFKQRMNGSYPFENQIRCAGPAGLRWQNLRYVNPEDLICEETTPVYSSTIHILDSTLSLSPVSSSSPFHQSEMPSKAPTQRNTPTADSTPGWSTVSSSPLFSPLAKSTSKAATLPQTPSNTPTAESKPHVSTDSSDSPFSFQSTMTESNTDPADGGIILSVPLLATLGVILGLSIICAIGFAVGCMYKRRQRDPTPLQGFINTNPTGTFNGNDQIRLQAIQTNAEINTETPHPDTAEYDTIDEVNQSESSHRGASNRQSLDNFGHLVLTPPPLPPQNQTRQMQQLVSDDDYEYPSPSLYPVEASQSHKYVNSHVTAAAKDAAAGPQDVVYEYENYEESVDNQSQTAAAPGADSPHHYEPLRNPSSQQQHAYTSLVYSTNSQTADG